MLTHDRLLEVLDYNRETGIFRWKVSLSNRAIAGNVAGTCHKGTYIRISVDKQIYEAAPLAWFYVHGVWPTNEIDHKDRIGYHNGINNLRDANRKEQERNKLAGSRNTSGFKGVSWHKQKQNWRASIVVDCKPYHLGSFNDIEMAAATYIQASWDFHGEFAVKEF